MLKLDLQMFAEDAPGAVSTSGDVTGGAEQAAGTEQQNMTPFQQMIQGQYRDEYEQAVGQRVQQAIQKRFRGQQDMQKRLQSVDPILQELGRRYQVEGNDPETIYKKMTDDLSLYQEEADKLGVTPQEVRTRHQNESRIRQLEAIVQQRQQEDTARNHYANLLQQADELKKVFPSFDLQRELQNPRFMRMTSPQVGISVKDAFYAIHGEEIQRNSIQYAAQQAGQRIAASVQAGASRPMENGMNQRGPVNLGVDIAHMDKKTRAAYRQRIKNGELINFTDKV